MTFSQDVTASDHFCGAGGASIGLIAAGVRVLDAANHWQAACAVYNRNNPDTRVHCGDLGLIHPERFPRTDIGWFSPECRTFSPSAPADRLPELFDDTPDSNVARSRVSMADVVRYTDWHRYELVIVENVIEVTRKYPIDEWYRQMVGLGYDFRVLSINSMVCWPTPQSRDRWYACFWRTGNPPPDFEIRPRCWCPTCEVEVEGYQWWKREPNGDPRAQCGKYRRQYLYRCSRCQQQALPLVWPALAALDLSLPCPLIGDKARDQWYSPDSPYAPATMRRIEIGLERFGPGAIVQGAGNLFERPGYYRTWPLWQPLMTQTATLQHGLALVNAHQSGSDPRYDANRVTAASWPMNTQTGQLDHGVLIPMRTHNGPKGLGEPLAALTTAHGGGQALLAFVDGGKGAHPMLPATFPDHTVTGEGSQFLVTLRQRNEARSDQEPLATLCASGGHHGVVTAVPFLAPYNRTATATSGLEPAPTLTAKDRAAVVEPSSIDVMDCGFRMMEPHEAGAAQAFPASYEVHGSKRVRVKLYGQAVSPPVAGEITGRAIASLGPA